jgi:glutamate/aspartate transport system substrate-binding protein
MRTEESTGWLGAALTLATLLFLTCDVAAQVMPTLEKIRRNEVIVIGWRQSPPFAQLGTDGYPVGYQVDLCRHIALAASRRLGLPKLQVKYVQVDLKTRIERLKDGTIDLECASSTNTRARQQQVAVSYNTFVAGVRLLVQPGSQVRSIKDMDGKRLAVAAGSSTVDLAKRVVAMHGVNAKVVEFESQTQAMLAVRRGEADAMISEETILAALAATPEGKGLNIVGSHLSIEPYAILLRKGDPEFERVVDLAMADAFASGEGIRLYEKWFNSADGIRIPLSQYIRECFKYPTKYGV